MRTLALLLLLATPAFADEIEKARALACKGKLDEAEKVLDDAIPRLQGKEARDARRARAEVTSRRPERASFEKARDLYVALAGEDEKDVETRWALYELFWMRGERLVAAGTRTDDRELLAEARRTLTEGADYLATEAKALEAKGTEDADRALVACGFFRPRCLAALGRLDKNKDLMTQAVTLWADYGVRFGREPEGYEAAIDMAETLAELGRADEALQAIDCGLAVEDTAVDGKLAPEAFEVFERAALVKGRLLRKDAKAALAVLEKAIALAAKGEIKDEATAVGRNLRIERAWLWARDGKQAQAVKELERLAALDPRGATGDLARERLAQLLGSSVEASCDEVLAKMNEALEHNQPTLARAHARTAQRAARREAKKDKESLAMEGLAKAFEGERRVLEAAIAFEEATKLAPAPGAALGFVRCAEIVRARDPGPFASGLCQRALSLLEARDPAAKRGLAPFLLAKQLQEDGRYAEAAKAYDEVAPEAGEIHDEALYGSACCRFAAANGEKAALETVEVRLRALLARPKSDVQARAHLLLAEVLLQLARPGEVEPFVPGDTVAELQYRAIALARLDRPVDAEALVALLLDRKALDHRTAVACHELVLASKKASDALPPEARRAARARLARYFEVWLDDATPAQVAWIGQTTFTMATDVLGLPERGGFLVDLDAVPAPEAKPLLLVSAKAWEKLLARGPKERWRLLATRAESLAFAGEEATAAFSELVKETKLLDENGHVASAVAAKEPLLLGYLADMGICELRASAREKGESHLAAVVEATREATPLWWQVRLALLRDLDRRGAADDLKQLKLTLRALERKYPRFEAAKDLAPRFLELRKRYD